MADKTDGKKKRLHLSLRLLTGLVAAAAVVLCIASIVMTGIFIFDSLRDISGEHFSLSGSSGVRVETFDLERLQALTDEIDQKNALDAPREGRLHNAFLEPALPSPPTADTNEE
ncbi:MAG: hypothetical protein ABIJ46_00675 [bacterium]